MHFRISTATKRERLPVWIVRKLRHRSDEHHVIADLARLHPVAQEHGRNAGHDHIARVIRLPIDTLPRGLSGMGKAAGKRQLTGR